MASKNQVSANRTGLETSLRCFYWNIGESLYIRAARNHKTQSWLARNAPPMVTYPFTMVSLPKSLRILFISRQFYPVAHGAENQILRLARSLQDRGHGVQVLSARFNPHWPREEILEGGVPVIRLPSPSARGVGTLCFLASVMAYLDRHRTDYDVIHVNTLKYAAAIAALWKPNAGMPVLARSLCAGPEGDMAHLQSLPFPHMVLKCLHRLDCVVALSREIRAELIAHGFSSGKVALIPNAIDENHFTPPSQAQRELARTRYPGEMREGLVLITTARLVAQKGISHLIDSLHRPETRQWKAIILGEGHQRLHLEAQAKGLGLQGRIAFLGAQEQVRPWLWGADAFCLPSLYEGMSNALLEAMACGLPILATRVSGSLDIIRDGIDGILVAPADPVGLGRGLQRLLDSETRSRLSQAARQRVVELCGINVVTGRYIQLYERMIRSGGFPT